jgi:predicted GNAT family acetyltransferase
MSLRLFEIGTIMVKDKLKFEKYSMENRNVKFGFAKTSNRCEIIDLCLNVMKQWGKIDSEMQESIKRQIAVQIERNLIFCAFKNERVIGFTSVIDRSISGKINKHRLHITNTVISDENRKLGIATKLRELVIEFAGINNYVMVTTNHHKDNEVMQNLSIKFNFKEFPEDELLPTDKDSISYKLVL